MSGRKIAALVAGLCGVLAGVAQIVIAFVEDVAAPRAFQLLFAAACFANAALALLNLRRK